MINLENFAENYQFLVQYEILSYHWSKEYCALHPLLVYFIDGDGNIQHNSLCFISHDNNHNTNFAYKMQTILVNYLIENLPIADKIFYFSGGCAEQYKNHKNVIDLCVREIASFIFFSVSQEEMVNICADLEHCFAESKTVPGTRSSHHFVPISCYKIAHKLTSEDIEFLQFDFNRSLTKEIDIKNIKCFLYISCIYITVWLVGIVTEVNVHESDLEIEFLHPYGPRKTFSWPSITDKCFVPASNILCVIAAPATIAGQMYWISDTEFEQTLKAYENHKM